MKVIYYNKAVMFAICAGEAERYPLAAGPRVSPPSATFRSPPVSNRNSAN